MNSRRLTTCLTLALGLLFGFGLEATAHAEGREYVLLSGGPALRKWEDLRAPGMQHDRWWGNFIRPARMRIEEIQKKDPGAQITWLVHRNAFVTRSAEDKRSLTALVESVRDKFHVNLRWIDNGSQVINYLNYGQPRNSVKICDFEYFGHSNKYCFMFDYSNQIFGCSKSWLHQKELGGINRGIFTRDAFCKSWGCHTGESMSKVWRKATGVPMIGAFGKTDYSNPLQVMLSPGGRWTKG
ncbi:MAG: hypothetical protein RL693_2424 [Verrucomicrobiota bacterium]|jgi:hypothetical protein